MNVLNSIVISSIDFNHIDHTLDVSFGIEGSDMPNFYYACYLTCNDVVVNRQHYKLETNFSFKLTISKPSAFTVKLYVFDKKNNIKTSKSFKLPLKFFDSSYYTENLSSFINNNTLGYSESFFEKSIIEFNGFEPIMFSDINGLWLLDPFNNRTWRWNLLQLSIINYCIAYNQSNNNDDFFVSKVKEIIYSFKEYMTKHSSDPMLWHDHGTAIRTSNLCFLLYNLLKQNCVHRDDELFKVLIDLISHHLKKLSDVAFYSQHTNHGFDQSLMLYQVSLELENIIDTSAYINIAIERVISEINYAFCADGGHKENSPAYLNFGIKQCLSALNIEYIYNGKIKSFQNVGDIVDKATIALLHTTKPNGQLPLIGDTSTFVTKNTFSHYEPKHYQNFLYSISQGSRGIKPDSNFLVLPETGYALIRSHWNKDNFKEAIFLTLKASYHSNYHRHDDDLSITLYGFGEDWIVDGGIYKYDNRDKFRKYIRSHRSHNLTSPVGVIANRQVPNPKSTGIDNWSFLNNRLTVSAFSSMFTAVEGKSVVEFDYNTDTMSITNIFSSEKSQEFITRFFIDEGKVITKKDNKIFITSKSKRLIIEILTDINYTINIVDVESLGDSVIGKLSKVNYKLYQSLPIEINYEECVNLSIQYKLYFEDV